MEELNGMIQVGAGRTIALLTPADDAETRNAAAMLGEELSRRAAIEVSSRTMDDPSDDAALRVYLAPANALPEAVSERLEAPVPIHPYPDYASHTHLAVMSGEPPALLLTSGAARALPFAAGRLLQHLRVFADRVEIPPLHETRRPLNPMRGLVFDGAPDEYASRQSQLWGNNLIGGTRPFEDTCHERRLLMGPPARAESSAIVCFSPGDEEWRLELDVLPLEGEREFWLDASRFSPDALQDLLDDVFGDPFPPVRVLAHRSAGEGFETLKREAPLSMQLAALHPLAGETALDLARAHTELAPMIYAALGVCGGEAEWARFVWSSLGWSPQDSLEDMLKAYARCYYGEERAAEAAARLMNGEAKPFEEMKRLA
ncbi:MAG: hypothetical protein GC154_08170 [bacterium]|nr:hypothetical protein [bacterium]